MQKLLINIDVIIEIVSFDLSKPNVETAGLLLGKYEDNVLYIEEMEVGDQQANAVHVEISEQALTEAVVRMSSRVDDRVIVGWWHTHPNLSSFMSSTDISTQSRYQSLFPQAVAIVVDPVKYSKTKKIEDLDFGVYQVDGQKYHRLPYEIYMATSSKYSSELLLNQAIFQIDVPPSNPNYNKEEIKLKVPNIDKILSTKKKLKVIKGLLPDQDYNTLDIWLDLGEAFASGTEKDIPIDVKNLIEGFNDNTNALMEKIDFVERLHEDKKDRMTMFLIFIGVALEVGIFWLFSIGF
jgi:proteasome lid subunit RPN8/RPN11